MKLITWNTQWSCGVDGKVDPGRIVADARELGDFDVLCLQEVASNFPALKGSHGENQFDLFARLLPGYTAVSAFGVDVAAADGGRALFGNMILCRYPVLRVLRHQLPWPTDTTVMSMPRVLLEVTMSTPRGALRVMTTHLEYYSAVQRTAQVEATRSIYAQACAHASRPRMQAVAGSTFEVFDEPVGAILTGDFNFRQDDPLHARLQQAIDADAPRLVDTWSHLYPNTDHRHNVGVYDREQWPEPFTCDYIFASEDLLPRVRDVRVHGTTQASDHQPQLLELE
jgi:endonuclease/exonuclease/phosphatase family metal-dependent hydrolase